MSQLALAFDDAPVVTGCSRCGAEEAEPRWSQARRQAPEVDGLWCACHLPAGQAHDDDCAAVDERGCAVAPERCTCGRPRVRMGELRERWLASGWPWCRR